MHSFGAKSALSDVPDRVNTIEKIVYEAVKPYGFKRFGRTLHRFVSEDISQVIGFQAGLPSMGCSGRMWVNLGIRVPECAERDFHPAAPAKKHYREADCNIRSRLGEADGKGELVFDLKKDPVILGNKAARMIVEKIIPVYDVLSSREAILAHRREYPGFDTMQGHLILLEETFIYGHLGRMDEAKRCFDEYCRRAVENHARDLRTGSKHFLFKGEKLTYRDQHIVADRTGWYTVYDANRGHLEYLEGLAARIGFSFRAPDDAELK